MLMLRMFSKRLKLDTNPSFHFVVLSASLVIVLLTTFILNIPTLKRSDKPETKKDESVLGANIYISGGDQGYSLGGMIALSTQDDPYVELNGYGVSGDVQVDVYRADEKSLIQYLVHDKDKKQLQKDIDTTNFTFVAKVNEAIVGNYSQKRLNLPIEGKGIWYLRISAGGKLTHAYIVRSDMGAVVKEGNNEFILWAQDFKTKKSITDAQVKIYNLENSQSELWGSGFNSDGIAVAPLKTEADIAILSRGEDRAVVPINLQNLNTAYSYNQFTRKSLHNKLFVFTDRPLYKPGDKMYFKSILREDDDARYSIPTGVARVKITYGWGDDNIISDKNYPISSTGSVVGDWSIPANAKTGSYIVTISTGDGSTESVYFSVEFFRKPEYSLDLSSTKTEFVSGDKAEFILSGNYFSGQALSNQKVSYTVYSSDYYEYNYVSELQTNVTDDYRYGWWGTKQIVKSETTLDKNGKATVSVDTKFDATTKKTQILSIEASFDNGSGNPSFARKNVIVFSGEYGIYQKELNYYHSAKINEAYKLPIVLVSRKNKSVTNKELVAKVHRTNWLAEYVQGEKYPRYKQEKEDLPDIRVVTDSKGEATLSFTPTKEGSYELEVEGKDDINNTISKSFWVYVSNDDNPYYWNDQQASDLTINTDKTKYLPGETASLSIFSQIPNQNVLLTLERGYTHRYQVVRMQGKKGTVALPLETGDMPNIYAVASTFSDKDLLTNTVNLPVSPLSKKMSVTLTADRKTYGPGDTVTVNVDTKTQTGNPISAEVAVWTVDKALYELVANATSDIFNTFWNERYNATRYSHSLQGILVNSAERGGGCFAEGTKITMSDGSEKPIESIAKGEYVLSKDETGKGTTVAGKVIDTHKKQVDGYLIINGNLKVTTNHRMFVNGVWKDASSIQTGDKLFDTKGQEVTVTSLEWIRGMFTVYNLTIETYHTYFANGIWVHNQKGDVRQLFKDTAYWNPTVRTDESGKAQITFKLPDNLTTWVLSAVSADENTVVGQTKTELIVSKDVIVRPILPNILRVGDEARLSALVQNFTETDQVFDIDATFDAGQVKNATQSAVVVKSKETKQLYWEVLPMKANPQAKITFSARSQTNKGKNSSDTIISKIPVRAFGFAEITGSTGDNDHTYPLQVGNDLDFTQSKITLSVSPTLLGTLPSAMKYLVDYPYGCVEQTTSRFVPAVIAKANPVLLNDVLEGKNVDEMIEAGLKRLQTLQMPDGGWGWWSGGGSDPFITAYVLEYILYAEKLGSAVDQGMLSQAKAFVQRPRENESPEQRVMRLYAISLFSKSDKSNLVKDFTNFTTDMLSLTVMSNFRNGDQNPASNGLTLLLSKANAQGDSVFWNEGFKNYFGSKDASTALAIRAILEAKGDRSIAAKGTKYLLKNRQNYFWSNSYATSQVIRAAVDLSQTGNEQNPNYTYSVLLDGKTIATGSVTNANQILKPITVPLSKIIEDSKLTVVKNGEGQLYSTLIKNEYHTSKEMPAVQNGIEIKREYENEKGPQYNIAVGDIVNVKLTISGLQSNDFYGVIEDDLPAGLIPVNETFKNQQSRNTPNDYYFSWMVGDREYKENGIVMSLYQVKSEPQTHTYKAVAVNGGTYWAPPARTSLMYSPEINGRSSVTKLTIEDESKIDPSKIITEKIADIKTNNVKVFAYFLIGFGIILFLFVFAKHKHLTATTVKEWILRKIKRTPKEPTQTNATIVVPLTRKEPHDEEHPL